ncbi:MAG: hypothetical protein ACO3EP_10415 [Phycisphaerales bacterium]|jgi:hypothetical protein
MEARRTRDAARARVAALGIWWVIAIAAATGIVAAHRTVAGAAERLELAERELDRGAEPWSPCVRPPITASISTVASCASEEIALDRCHFRWRPVLAPTHVRPSIRIEGRAASSDAVGRFVDRLEAHAFLGEATIESLRPHGEGAVSFEVAIGAESERAASSIVVLGGRP